MDMDSFRPATVTVQEAAITLGISRDAAYRAVHAGEIPGIKLGRRLVVPIDGLRALLRDGNQRGGASPVLERRSPEAAHTNIGEGKKSEGQ